MTILWTLVWAFTGAFSDGWPVLEQWNGWAVFLLLAVALDLGGGNRG